LNPSGFESIAFAAFGMVTPSLPSDAVPKLGSVPLPLVTLPKIQLSAALTLQPFNESRGDSPIDRFFAEGRKDSYQDME